jgi:hypothetical protein
MWRTISSRCRLSQRERCDQFERDDTNECHKNLLHSDRSCCIMNLSIVIVRLTGVFPPARYHMVDKNVAFMFVH